MTSITKRPWLFLLLAAFAGLAMLFAACGGGDDDDNGGDDTTATATHTTDSGDDGGDGETPTATDDNGGDDDDGSDDPFADLQNLTGDFANVSGKVAYETTDSSDGTTSTFVLYSDADKNRSRFDSADSSGGVFTIITTADATYTCTAEQGQDGVCLKGPGSEDAASSLGLFGLFASPALLAQYVDSLAGIDVKKSNEEIAGTDAKCFSWEGTIEGESGSGKICLADNGIMLSADFESSDGTSTHMKATDVSDHVSDSDFEPPYEVTEIPGQ